MSHQMFFLVAAALLSGAGFLVIPQVAQTSLTHTVNLQSIIAVTLAQASTSTTVTLPIAEPDTNYGVVCTPDTTSVFALSVSGKTTTTFVINYLVLAATQHADCLVAR